MRLVYAGARPESPATGGARHSVDTDIRFGLQLGPSALLGVLTAGISHAIRRALAMLPAISAARSQLVSASASVLTGGVVVYVVGRFFLG